MPRPERKYTFQKRRPDLKEIETPNLEEKRQKPTHLQNSPKGPNMSHMWKIVWCERFPKLDLHTLHALPWDWDLLLFHISLTRSQLLPYKGQHKQQNTTKMAQHEPNMLPTWPKMSQHSPKWPRIRPIRSQLVPSKSQQSHKIHRNGST